MGLALGQDFLDLLQMSAPIGFSDKIHRAHLPDFGGRVSRNGFDSLVPAKEPPCFVTQIKKDWQALYDCISDDPVPLELSFRLLAFPPLYQQADNKCGLA
jgi:hypothetical protein